MIADNKVLSYANKFCSGPLRQIVLSQNGVLAPKRVTNSAVLPVDALLLVFCPR